MPCLRRSASASSIYFHVLAMAVLGACKSSPEPDAVMLDNAELRWSEEDYTPPPVGCPMSEPSGRPVLPMPWFGVVETYLSPGQPLPELDLDYEVGPLARMACSPRSARRRTRSSR